MVVVDAAGNAGQCFDRQLLHAGNGDVDLFNLIVGQHARIKQCFSIADHFEFDVSGSLGIYLRIDADSGSDGLISAAEVVDDR